jgi:cell division inhibitor SepF
MAFWKKKNDNENMDFENDYYEDDNMQEYDDVEEEQDYVEPEIAPTRSAKVIRMTENTKDMETNTEMNMIIFRPTEYDQAQTIIDYLKLRKPIIVNLDEIEVSVAQRILDFITGAVYALSGDIKKAARNIFVVVPSNVEISNANDEQVADAQEYEEEEYQTEEY